MQENKTNYGKIIAITLAVISAASAIAYVIYRLCRSFFAFCDSYQEDELEDVDFDFDEIDDSNDNDNFLIVDDEESENADAKDTTAQDSFAETTEM